MNFRLEKRLRLPETPELLSEIRGLLEEEEILFLLFQAICKDNRDPLSPSNAKLFLSHFRYRNPKLLPFSQAENIPMLDLSNMKLGLNSVWAIIAVHTKHRPILRLNISQNAVRDYGVYHLKDLLSSPSTVELNVASCQISSLALEKLDSSLSRLQKLDLGAASGSSGRNLLGPDGARALSKLVDSSTHLESLRLVDNGFEGTGVIELGRAFGRSPSLRHLVFASNGLTPENCAVFLQPLQNLESLDLSGNALGPEALPGLVAFFARSRKLRSASLAHTLQPPELLPAIAEALRANPSLATLDLAHNPLEATGLDALAVCLPDLQIESLSLEATCRNPQTNARLLRAALAHRHLRVLNFASNPLPILEDPPFQAPNGCLRELDLSACLLTDSALPPLLDSLGHLSALQRLALANNLLTELSFEGLFLFGSSAPKLKKILLSQNRISPLHIKSLEKHLTSKSDPSKTRASSELATKLSERQKLLERLNHLKTQNENLQQKTESYKTKTQICKADVLVIRTETESSTGLIDEKIGAEVAAMEVKRLQIESRSSEIEFKRHEFQEYSDRISATLGKAANTKTQLEENVKQIEDVIAADKENYDNLYRDKRAQILDLEAEVSGIKKEIDEVLARMKELRTDLSG